MDCTEPACLAEWQRLGAGTTDEENASYDSGDYGWQHCEVPDCHEIYPKGKNGATCDRCGMEVCEGCSCDESIMILDEEDDIFICVECNKIDIKELRKQNYLKKRASKTK